MKVAIMQPYFYPYLAYYRLFLKADMFVIYDCVQFPRRGRVHRAPIEAPSASQSWLTLPLEKSSRESLIQDQKFSASSHDDMQSRMTRLGWLNPPSTPHGEAIRVAMLDTGEKLVDYLEQHLRIGIKQLDIDRPMIRSSTLDIPAHFKSQDRILEILSRLGGTQYINLPGGRELYDKQAFSRRDIGLEFLEPYSGSYMHMLRAFCEEPAQTLIKALKT